MTYYCDVMRRYNAEYTCDVHADRPTCPECCIAFEPASGTYGIVVHDGGSSMIVIQFCPWCGTRLSTGDKTLPAG